MQLVLGMVGSSGLLHRCLTCEDESFARVRQWTARDEATSRSHDGVIYHLQQSWRGDGLDSAGDAGLTMRSIEMILVKSKQDVDTLIQHL